jgi:diaminopimelate decarboxylase
VAPPASEALSPWARRVDEARISAAVRAVLAAGHLGDESPAVVLHDLDLLAARLERLVAQFPASALHAVAIKANPVLRILERVVAGGAGLEAASWEEVELARAAGCEPGRIVYDSPAKTTADLARALALGVRINVDNVEELTRLDTLAPGPGARVGLRINPAVGAGMIAATSVGDRGARFGVPWPGSAAALAPLFAPRPWLRGLHVHVGSQGSPMAHLVAAARRAMDVRAAVHEALGYPQIDVVDLGGGVPTDYGFRSPPPANVDDYEAALRREVPELFEGDVMIVTELGRAVQVGCGVALSRVEYVKRPSDRDVAVIHLGADFMVRTAYTPEAWPHEIVVLQPDGTPKTGPRHPWTIVGPLCFAGDVVAADRPLPAIEPGDLVAIRDVGGYTMGMWSRHCSRGLPPVLGLLGEPPVVVTLRARETAADVVAFWRG